MKPIYDIRELESDINEQDAILVYFSNDACNVCKVLKPKVSEMTGKSFPRVKLLYVDTEKSPFIAGQYRIFTIPTILIFIQGKEHARFSRNINMHELEESIARPYGFIYGNTSG